MYQFLRLIPFPSTGRLYFFINKKSDSVAEVAFNFEYLPFFNLKDPTVQWVSSDICFDDNRR